MHTKFPHTISKTSFLSGTQCSKLLWMKLHERDAFPPVSEQQQAIFDQGHEIGAMAKGLYPGGIEVAEGIYRHDEALKATLAVLSQRKPLYEPAFAHNGGFVRVDILNPCGDDAWEIIEVKSGTKVKKVNLLDVAFQKYVCEGAGLKIMACSVMHINTDYVREGEVDPKELLIANEVSGKIEDLAAKIPQRLEELKKIASESECPDVAIGPHCTHPYSCDLTERCWSFLPRHPVTDLCSDSKGRKWEWLESGVHGLADIPEGEELNRKQSIQHIAAKENAPQVEAGEIASFLDSLEYPLAFFDLESFNKAVPPYDHLRPYRQIPFQFSVHVQDQPGSELKHHDFLAADAGDPRCPFMEELIKVIPGKGSIVAYSASVEKGRIKECAELFPQFQPWVNAVSNRFVDLLVPFRNFSFYHPDQAGSASIKNVLPALTDTSYSDLSINEGMAASLAFVEMAFDPETTEERKAEIRKDLLEYCALDTRAMVDIVDALRALVN
jgi:hypothetical protein